MSKKLIATLAGGLAATVIGVNSARVSNDIGKIVEETKNRPVVNAVATILDRTPLKYVLSPRNKFLIGAYGVLKRNPQITENVKKGSGYLAGAGMLGTFLAANRSYSNMYNKRKK